MLLLIGAFPPFALVLTVQHHYATSVYSIDSEVYVYDVISFVSRIPIRMQRGVCTISCPNGIQSLHTTRGINVILRNC